MKEPSLLVVGFTMANGASPGIFVIAEKLLRTVFIGFTVSTELVVADE